MHINIAVVGYLFGVIVAVLSAHLVLNQQKSRLWYALPSVYCLLLSAIYVSFLDKKIDIAAVVFFSVVLTIVGWGTAKTLKTMKNRSRLFWPGINRLNLSEWRKRKDIEGERLAETNGAEPAELSKQKRSEADHE